LEEDFEGDWLDLTDGCSNDAMEEQPETIDVRRGHAATGSFSAGIYQIHIPQSALSLETYSLGN